jgi:pilus assembly protein CpaB
MRSRALIFAILAIVLAAITVIVARNGRTGSPENAEDNPQAPKSYVLVAARDLQTGLLLHPDDFVWQVWPGGQVNDSYLQKDRDDAGALTGAVVRLRIGKGEPISASRVIKPGERGFLAAVLGPGMRATSLQLNTTSDIAGLILPGDHVDLLLSHTLKDERLPNAPQRLVSETILTNVRVVAIDQVVNDLDKKPISGKTATFEVTPKQAEMIEVAKMIGNLSLVLRSVANEQGARDETVNDLTASNVAQAPEVTHTWDNEVSPLIHHREPGDESSAYLSILRGGGAQAAAAPAGAR